MKNRTEEIEALIRETLNDQEVVFYDSLGEQNLFEMVAGLFKTKLRWLIILMNCVQIISFGLFIYCGIHFLEAEESNELITWGVGGFLFLIIATFIKLFSWMQMDKNAILRQMKRLELQIALVANKQG